MVNYWSKPSTQSCWFVSCPQEMEPQAPVCLCPPKVRPDALELPLWGAHPAYGGLPLLAQFILLMPWKTGRSGGVWKVSSLLGVPQVGHLLPSNRRVEERHFWNASFTLPCWEPKRYYKHGMEVDKQPKGGKHIPLQGQFPATCAWLQPLPFPPLLALAWLPEPWEKLDAMHGNSNKEVSAHGNGHSVPSLEREARLHLSIPGPQTGSAKGMNFYVNPASFKRPPQPSTWTPQDAWFFETLLALSHPSWLGHPSRWARMGVEKGDMRNKVLSIWHWCEMPDDSGFQEAPTPSGGCLDPEDGKGRC